MKRNKILSSLLISFATLFAVTFLNAAEASAHIVDCYVRIGWTGNYIGRVAVVAANKETAVIACQPYVLNYVRTYYQQGTQYSVGAVRVNKWFVEGLFTY